MICISRKYGEIIIDGETTGHCVEKHDEGYSIITGQKEFRGDIIQIRKHFGTLRACRVYLEKV